MSNIAYKQWRLVAYEWDYEVLTLTWAVLGTQKYLVLRDLNVYLSSAMLYDVGCNCVESGTHSTPIS